MADVLVVGASGLVGRVLSERFGARAAATHLDTAVPGGHRLDVRDAAAVERVLDTVAPRVVVHAAAYTDVNGCETDPERSHQTNVGGALNVARAAACRGCRVLFFSTDYVFAGVGGPHAPDAPVAPMNVYGRHKLEAERAVLETCGDAVVVRGCNIYGYQPGGKNFAMAVYELGRSGRTMRVPSDQYGCPTLAADFADAVERLAAGDRTGVVHVAGPDYVSRPEWATRAAAAFGLDPAFIEAVPTSELGQAAPRPLEAGLQAADTERELGLRFSTLDQGLTTMAKKMGTGTIS